MAYTKVSDIIEPTVFAAYVIERTAELSALWQSGIIGTDAQIASLVAGGGTQIDMPFWSDLSGNSEILSDLEGGGLTPANIGTSQDKARKQYRGKAWKTNELAAAIAGSDPMLAIGNLVAAFWARDMQDITIATLTGVFASTTILAQQVSDISGAGGAAAIIDADAILDCAQLMGDAKGLLTGLIMHSATENVLAKANLIDYVADANQATGRIAMYGNRQVIVDDGCPVDGAAYTTYLFGPGALAYGEGAPAVPVETDRTVLEGMDILVNRRHFILHPRGVAWQESAIAGNSPTLLELAEAAQWARVYEKKNVPLAALVHTIA